MAGWANANDAFHATGTSPEGHGAQKAMKEALNKAKLSNSEIDYINAHGTATGNNDSSELSAMQAVFNHQIPAFSSTKSFTGHTLAAAGGVESVFSILSLLHNLLPGNLNCKQAIEGSENLLKESQRQTVDNVLSNSFGFGGNCTSLIFKRVC